MFRVPREAIVQGSDVLPSFAGATTFLRAQAANLADVPPGSIAVVGVPHDTTAASRPGARWGPAAIRAASAELDYFLRSSEGGELVDVDTGRGFAYRSDGPALLDCGDLMVFPVEPQRTIESVSNSIAKLTSEQTLPVGLGGDHFVSYPLCKGAVEGLRAVHPHAKIGYIQIDADLDISSENPTWGRWFHGTNARRVAELPGVETRNMVMFATSGFTRRDQWEFVRSAGITLIPLKLVRELGASVAMHQAIEIALRDADALYVTCDIDAVDGAYAPGTGGIKFRGLLPTDLLEAAEVLSEVENLVGVDVVEVAPNLDPSGRTPALAASFLAEVLAERIFLRRPAAMP